jgi:hypothetical protein
MQSLLRTFLQKILKPKVSEYYIAIFAAIALEAGISAWREFNGFGWGTFGWAVVLPIILVQTVIIIRLINDIRSKIENIDIIKDLNNKIDNIGQNLDITIKYFPVDATGSRQCLFEECQKIISKAHTSILALNSYAEEKAAGQDLEARKAYFSALMQASHRLEYTRVVQMATNVGGAASPSGKLVNFFDELYLKHFEEMITERQVRTARPNSHKIVLTIAEPRFPSTFLIIDEEYLIWELMEIEVDSSVPMGSKKERFRMRAILIINDKRKEIIHHFNDTVRRVQDTGYAAIKDHLR